MKKIKKFQIIHNNNVIFEGSSLKPVAYDISKKINENPNDSFSLTVSKPFRRKWKVFKEITNNCDITEYLLFSLL